MDRRRTELLAALTVGLCIACGDDGAAAGMGGRSVDGGAVGDGGAGAAVLPTPGVGQGGASRRQCGAWLNWATRCGMETDYYQTCLDGPWDSVQPAYIDATTTCFATLSCEASDDQCTDQGLTALGIDAMSAADDALWNSCHARADMCDVSEDLCLAVLVYTAEARVSAEACLAGSCADLEACLNDP